MTYKKLYTMDEILQQPMGILDRVDLSEFKPTRQEQRKFYWDMGPKECNNPHKHGFVAGWTENIIWPKGAEKEWLYHLPGHKDFLNDSFENRKNCRPTYYLRKNNLTGQNISIAIIYKELNINHPEYAGNIAHYETLYPKKQDATLEASVVVSTAVGKTCGAAPNANLHYFAAPADKDANGHTDALKRVIEYNKTLPENKKIRFLVCPWDDTNTKQDAKQQQMFKQCQCDGMLVMALGNKNSNFDYNPLVTYSGYHLAPSLRSPGFGVDIDDHVVAYHLGGYVLLRYAGVPAAMACMAGGFASIVSGEPNFYTLKNWQGTLEDMAVIHSSRETQHYEFYPSNIIGYFHAAVQGR